ncbi:MAG TPA: peptidase A2A [Microcoleaceae bacterium UBA10368]|jgi:Predicted aspartyl protease|nr:peptidase A2A [Microcoleaceae cyanobacterium UBA10368]HCV31476.1 peptidase A2A [Microcoleaceae cyanobacterium UBA9251]
MPAYQKVYRLLRYGQNLLAVQATVGSREGGDFVRVRLLVDTGSSFTILPVQVLQNMGYDTRNPLRRQELVTGQGRIYAPVINLSWFNCVGKFIENFDVFAHDIPPNLRIDGLLGMDFLTRFQAVISVGDAEIRFE